jgi:hypothetical protein
VNLGRPAHCPRGRGADTLGGVSKTEILLWIVALFILEVNHLKWIWWEFWTCRSCSVVHKDCSCGNTSRWVMYL